MSVVYWYMFYFIYSYLSFCFFSVSLFHVAYHNPDYEVAATNSTITHTFTGASFLVGYDCLLITSLLWGHLCVTPIKDDGSHCGWDNISTYLHLSQKQIKTDMWAVCHADTWAFPRKPAKSSECRWVITFWFSLTTVPHRLQAFITIVCVQYGISIIFHSTIILFICFWYFIYFFYWLSLHLSSCFMLLPGSGFMEHIKLMRFTSTVTMVMTLDWAFLT